MKTLRTLITLLISFTLTLQLLGAPLTQAAFQDAGDLYSETIEYLRLKGVIEGYRNGHFEPEKAITRAEFIKILLANYGYEPTEESQFVKHPYSDVEDESWYAPYIQKAWEIGLLESKSSIQPQGQITRVEGAELIMNLLGIALPRVVSSEDWPLDYRDVSPTAWYAPIVLYGIQNNLIGALEPENDYFRPIKKLTRGETTLLMYNMDAFIYGTELLEDFAILETELFGEEVDYDIPHLDTFLDVWTRIHEEYYPYQEFDEEELIYEAIQGMVEGLGDRYSVFFNPPEASEFNSIIEGQISGIGISLTETEKGVLIQSFIIGAPAETSGLQVNDVIIGVDGIDVRGKAMAEVASLIRGETGTDVELTVDRDGSQHTYTITRTIFNIGYVSGEVIGNAIYVDHNLFTLNGGVDFTETVEALIEENPDFKGFILDFRNNPGGYLGTAADVLGHFIPAQNTLAYLRFGENRTVQYLSDGEAEWADYPVVILINEGTASAAEIVTIALDEKLSATIVGKNSVGKGVVQEIIYYEDGSTLKLTFAEWLSPEFHSINEIGIWPDYEVERTNEDRENGEDPQLDKALEVLENKIAGRVVR